MSELEAWLAAQERVSAQALAAAISASGAHHRPGFGCTVTPAPGSVLASPVRALWDPDPDYFYHWIRDAGVVMLAAATLRPRDPPGWDARFRDYARFSLAIATRAAVRANPWRDTAAQSHGRFLRADAELAALAADALLGEPRVNADGTPDVEDWNRPQFDGPALRALSCLRWPARSEDAQALVALDLGHVLRHAAEPCIGPWEDPPPALHAFTLLAQREALHAFTLIEQREAQRAADGLDPAALVAATARIDTALESLCAGGHVRASSTAEPEETDASVVLGSLLVADDAAPFGVADPRILATARHVEAWSASAYAIATETAPLVGRWPGDRYFGGNPWLPTSFGFAEFHYRRAAAAPAGRAEDIAHGDRILAAVRAFVPTPGPLPEQLHRDTGAPAGCRDLTWSHAALLAAGEARRNADLL